MLKPVGLGTVGEVHDERDLTLCSGTSVEPVEDGNDIADWMDPYPDESLQALETFHINQRYSLHTIAFSSTMFHTLCCCRRVWIARGKRRVHKLITALFPHPPNNNTVAHPSNMIFADVCFDPPPNPPPMCPSNHGAAQRTRL
jgi:hypothetical protein